MEIRLELPPLLQRLYECLDACKKHFLAGCRLIIGVDGCHLKGPFSSQLLGIVGVDANDNMYPKTMAGYLYEINKRGWTKPLTLLFLKHNIDARASNKYDFEVDMNKLKEMNRDAYDYYILGAEDKPILTMLEMIRCNLMKRLEVKRVAMEKYEGSFALKFKTKLENIKMHSARNCMPTTAGGFEYQVGEYLHD
ncbi:hypothetical protein L3X38_004248 [Prunus dulcis]|uniref:Uncharacterized protein n=1 Tax=Prunus dulcis TaxID=3755 RepID=A0AAD4ZNM5_PRUDU|nr:hypothetical protein L3X38_004248 [Prunus dulcis]